MCCGSNTYGQLGTGDTVDRLTPTAVSVGVGTPARRPTRFFQSRLEPSLILSARRSGASAIGVAAGDSHTCALLRGGTVACWGNNGEGQLGTGDTTNRLASVSVNISTGCY